MINCNMDFLMFFKVLSFLLTICAQSKRLNADN